MNVLNYSFERGYYKMQSRIRKYRKSAEKMEEAIEKQLNSDFEVHEYLRENKMEGDNTEEYIRLLDSLLTGRACMKKWLLSLKARAQSSTANFPLSVNNSRRTFSQHPSVDHLDQFTAAYYEVKNNLYKEIIYTKKSLNLLKGDIGHLITRNYTAKLLSSKIAKVKIVADDQLKRVDLAFTKDKEEIKLTNELQKKFGKKLRNMQQIESSCLLRTKHIYVYNVQRKKYIFERLSYIYRIDQSIGQHDNRDRIKNQHNKRTLTLFHQLKKVVEVIRTFPTHNFLLTQGVPLTQIIASLSHSTFDSCDGKYDHSTYIKSVLYKTTYTKKNRISDDLVKEDDIKSCGNDSSVDSKEVKIDEYSMECVNETALKYFVNTIIEVNDELTTSIASQSEHYSELIRRREEGVKQLDALRCEQLILLRKFYSYLDDTYILLPSVLNQYSDSLKQFAKLLKTFFCLLQFLEQFSPDYKDCEFINELYDVYKELSYDRASSKLKCYTTCFRELYYKMTTYIQNGMNELKGKRKKKRLIRDKNIVLECLRAQLGETGVEEQGKYMKSDEGDMGVATLLYEKAEEYLSEYLYVSCINRKSQIMKVMTAVKAQRIQLLYDVDQDYYKLLKSVITMEKYNTRKNYLFLRNFKRSKFCARDDILYQKRFYASFSCLFSHTQVANPVQHLPARTMQYIFPFAKKHSTLHEPRQNIRDLFRVNKKNNPTQKSRLAFKIKEAILFA